MWDSFKYYKDKTDNEIDKFDAHDHFSKICNEHHLALAEFAKVNYQMGWSELLTHLVIELKEYPIKLLEVEDSYGQLEIKFEMLNKRKEIVVWQQLQYFKEQSRLICMGCGTRSSNLKASRSKLRFCSICLKSAARFNKTGTWLDKY